ncbi:TonB-dependent receptor domain-containing protein [Agarivorans sp. Z349TD_8]|uniref:TonB-dependent receptor domain-containing protein n=1 Tax=Agarivorans sp. Z349TD_8 TaxID=3421434 RepID=UPI003D7EFE4D
MNNSLPPILSLTQSKLALLVAAVLLNSHSSIAADAPLDNPVMVVTASSTEHTVQTAPAFTTVITAEDIKASPVNGLPDILEKYAGIINNSDSSGRNAIYIRGMDQGYTLILVNGKRVSSSASLWRGGDFDYSSIPLDAIAQVEIVRGPMSALYGSDAIGGVINIITKAPGKVWGGSIRQDNVVMTSGDEGAQSRTNLYASGQLNDRLSLSIAGEIYDRDAWYLDENMGTEAPALEAKNSQNIYTTLYWDINSQQQAEFDFNYNHDERPYSSYGDISSLRAQAIDRMTFGATHRGQWAWGSSTLYANYETSTIDDYNNRYDAPQQRQVKENNLLINGSINTELGFNNITTGGELQQQQIKDPVGYQPSGEANTTMYAVYLQDELSLGDKLTLTLGGRYDDHEVFGGHFTPRSYLVYQASNALTLKGGVSKAYKAPQTYQTNPEYQIISCGGGCSISGDPDLAAETSVNYELGFEYLQASWDVSVALYRSEVENLIEAQYAVINGTPSRWWDNVGEATLQGVELSGAVDITQDISLLGNYTYLDAEDNAGNPLSNRPEHVANANLNWWVSERLNSIVSAVYTGKQYNSGSELPAYTTVDLGLAFQATTALNLKAGVKNLFDLRLDEKSQDFSGHELGRNVYLSANYDF